MNRQDLVAFYDADLARYGPGDARSLHWVSQRTQWTRFQVLYELGPWDGVAVADVGSGLGDFAGFLSSRGHPVKPGPGPAEARAAGSTVWYNGYDVTPSMVQAARQKHPFGSFHHRDVLEQGFVGSPDYVIASGTFNIRLRDHEAWFKAMVTAMYSACRLAAAFNFLGLPASLASSPEPGRQDLAPGAWAPLLRWSTIYYEADPEKVLAFCQGLATKTEMRTGYLPNDYTIYMYRGRPPEAI